MKLLSTALSHISAARDRAALTRDSYTGVDFNLGFEVTPVSYTHLTLPTKA